MTATCDAQDDICSQFSDDTITPYLILWDLVSYAAANDILVFPGRGAIPGSLVAYCLGITDVDPIKYNFFI